MTPYDEQTREHARAALLLEGMSQLQYQRGRLSKVTVDDAIRLLARLDGWAASPVPAPTRTTHDDLTEAATFMLELVDQYYGTDHEFDVPEEAEFRYHRAVIDEAGKSGPVPAPILDVERLEKAMERAMATVDDEWTIPEFADITAAEYAALASSSETRTVTE